MSASSGTSQSELHMLLDTAPQFALELERLKTVRFVSACDEASSCSPLSPTVFKAFSGASSGTPRWFARAAGEIHPAAP